MGMMINRRRVMGGKLPYDAEIEYLEIDENTGLTVIDTGYNPLDSTTFIIKAKFILNGWVGSPSGYTPSILGNNFTSANQKATFWLRFNSDVRLSFYHARRHPSAGALSDWLRLPALFEIIHTHDKATINGKDLSNNLAEAVEPSPSNIYLFKNSLSPSPPYGKTRFYYFQVEDEGELKVDLIPCRIGNKGYMYDRVTNRFCTNIGTGEFILGLDKN